MNRQNFFALMLTCIGLLSTSQAVVQASNDTYTISILYDGSNRIMVNDKIVRDGVTYQFHPEGNWGIVFNYGLPVQCVIAGGYFEAIGFEGNVKMRDEFTASRYTNSILTASKENVIFEVRIVHSPDKISPEHDLEVYFDQNTTLSYTRHFPIKNPSQLPEGSHITSISLSSSWTEVPPMYFYGRKDLETVTLPSSIKKIGWAAFENCSNLASITVPNSVVSIEEYAFEGCSSLTSFNIPDGITEIADGTFWGCSSLTSIDIPNSVQSIGDDAFYECSKLESVSLPEYMTYIGRFAFGWCLNLQDIIIPKGLKYIESSSFSETGIKSIVIPEGVVGIKSFGFSCCGNLKDVKLPQTLKHIGAYAFSSTAIEEIQLPESLESISWCSDEDDDEDWSDPEYAVCAFDWSNLRKIFIPKNVTFIGLGSFSKCDNLEVIQVEEGNEIYDSRNGCNAIIETANNALLQGCGTTVIPEGVTTIRELAFYGIASLKSIKLPNSLICIEKTAFEETGLTKLNFPASMGYIGERAFEFCDVKEIIANNPNPSTIDAKAFITREEGENIMEDYIGNDSIYKKATLYVPTGSKKKYEETAGWNRFQNIVEMGSPLTPGDVNEDGVVDDEDMAAIADYVLGRKTAGVDMQSADVNNDGTVDVKDITFTISKAQFRLPITGSGISFTPSGAVDIEFTDTKEAFLLSDVLDWSEGDSYTVYFSKPAPDTGIRIGNEEIPGGLTSYHGTTPLQKNIHWEASNGQKFEKTFAWLMISAISPGKLHISDVVINKAGGEAIHCSYPFGKNGQAISRFYHVEADTGEEFEQYVDAFCKCSKIAYLSGKVTFNNAGSYIGGANWAAGKRIYELKLNSPAETDNLVWKYVTKNGVTRYQQIEKSVTESSIKVEEDISECYITLSPNANGSHTEVLDIQSICSKPY